jgi:Amt family ammonium transporter
MGAFLTGILAVPATLADGTVNPGAVNPNLAGNVDTYIHRGALWLEQLKAIGVTLVLAITATVVLAFVVKAVLGLRPAPEVERQGLDINEHGEEGYVEI